MSSSYHYTEEEASDSDCSYDDDYYYSSEEDEEIVRTMMGSTNGREAAPGTIRGDFGVSRQMNLMHGSDGPEAATREIAIYFQPNELIDSTPTLAEWMCASDEV